MAHADELALRLWLRDAKGIRERYGLTPQDVTRQAIERSVLAWAALVDGRVLGLFGVRVETIIGSAPATPWILPSVDVARMKKTFWKASVAGLALMLEHYPHLEAICDADFRGSIEWMRRLNFKFTGGPYLIANSGGISFVKFALRKGP